MAARNCMNRDWFFRPSLGAEHLIVAAAFAAAALIMLFPGAFSALADYPDGLIVPFRDWIAAIMAWLKTNFTWATRAVAAVIEIPLRFMLNLLARGFKFGGGDAAWALPRLSWLGITLVMAWLGYLYGGRRLALSASFSSDGS